MVLTARIFFKLLFAVLLVMVVALVAIDFLSSRTAQFAYIAGFKRELTEKGAMLARTDVWRLTPERVRELAHAAGARLTFIRPDGVVTLDSEVEPARMDNHGGRPEVREAFAGRTGVSVRPSSTLGVNFLYVAVPVSTGALRLAKPLGEIDAQINAVRKQMLVYTGLAFLPAILLAVFFARYFSSRLGAIIDYASTLATGNFRARLESTGNDELGLLGRQLNDTGSKLQKMFEELEREHQELERVERIRKDFVINVSHELRTPLASIQGYTETLLDGAIHDSAHNVRFLEIIRQNAERLTRLTSDLLTLSRVEMKTQKFQFASYDLPAMLDDCCDSLRPAAEKKNIRIELEPMAAKTEVFCDATSIHQIMSNLLDNAVKYTPESGRVTVATRVIAAQPRRPEMLEISVTDTGIGIPPAEIGRLFERFYRVDKARSRELGGTGLGLAIVKHLVRSHGGDTRVESVLNQGSTFSFTLPTQDIGQPDSAGLQTQFIIS